MFHTQKINKLNKNSQKGGGKDTIEFYLNGGWGEEIIVFKGRLEPKVESIQNTL